MNEPSLLLLMLGVPLAACVLVAAGLPVRRVSLLAGLVNVVLALTVWAGYDTAQAGYQFVINKPWVQVQDFFTIHFHIGVDGINLPLVVLTSLVALAAALMTPATVQREKEYHICLQLIALGALGAFVSLDLFFLYAFHEVALIPTFIMIGVWGGQDRKHAAWQITVYLGVGSLILLAGLLALYFSVPVGLRTFDLVALSSALAPVDPGFQTWILLLVGVGAGILVSLWPFHSWAAPAYAAAPAPVSMLHAGVLKKFGLYLLLRLAVPYLPTAIQEYAPWILVLLLGNVLIVGWITTAQKDLNLMLGFSSVMHMGFLFLGLATATLVGLSGVVVLMVAHGLSAALLFGLSGQIQERAGTTRLADLGGLATRAPQLAFLFILGGMASIGLPGLGNFAGEVMIFFGSWKSQPVVTTLVLWGVVLSAVYMIRAIRQVFYGPVSAGLGQAVDLSPAHRAACWVLALPLLAIGLYPQLVTGPAEPALRHLLRLRHLTGL